MWPSHFNLCPIMHFLGWTLHPISAMTSKKACNFSQRSSNVFYLAPIEMFLNSESFESSEGANKCYNSKCVLLWICTSYQLNSSKASTFSVYFSQLCVFNFLVQTMIKTRCAHGHWSPECTSSVHIVTHGVTKQGGACSHCLTPSNPCGDHSPSLLWQMLSLLLWQEYSSGRVLG